MRRTMKMKLGNVRIHLIIWLAFILYETLIVRSITQKFPSLVDSIFHYVVNISLFYFHAYIVLSVLLKKKLGLWLLPFAVAVEIVVYFFILITVSGLIMRLFSLKLEGIDWQKGTYLIKAIWRALYFMGFSTGYYFLITFLKEKERTVALEKQRLNQIIEQQKMEQELGKAQNAYLRAQINPHFLFNTLNFIYNKTRKSAPVAADAILTLSAMMRYAVESSEDKGYILIEEEIEQVHNLIHLHRLRQNHQIFFSIEAEDRARHVRVIPLILITLTENIFKHGNLSLTHHPATLKIYLTDDTLFIETNNLINAIHNKTGMSKGLENIAKRLMHSYGNAAHFIYTTDAKNHFRTQVQIKLEVLSVFGLPLAVSDNTDK